MVIVEPPSCIRGIDFKTYDTREESFRQIEHSDQIFENNSYESDQEFEMAKEGFEILRSVFGLDHTKTHDEHLGDLDIMENKVETPSPQALPSLEEHTSPITYPEEVEETIGTLIDREPLDQTPLENVGLDACCHDLSLSPREVPILMNRSLNQKPYPIFRL